MHGRPPGCGQAGSGTRTQRTSGRSCSHVTRPVVARSMSGHRTSGIERLPLRHWYRYCSCSPTWEARAARSDADMVIIMADSSATLVQRQARATCVVLAPCLMLGRMDPVVEALKRLTGNTKEGRQRVADLIDSSEQTIYQIVAQVPLKSGRPRSVGRKLRERLDQRFPGWMGHDGTPPGLPGPGTRIEVISQLAEQLRNVPRERREAVAKLLGILAHAPDSASTRAEVLLAMEPLATYGSAVGVTASGDRYFNPAKPSDSAPTADPGRTPAAPAQAATAAGNDPPPT